MAWDWSDYYKLAGVLCKTPIEAGDRSAISRAYYAAFCKARRNLEAIVGKGVVKHDAHSTVWQAYSDSMDPIAQDVGYEGFLLRDARNRADYDDQFPRSHAEAQLQLVRAKKILDAIPTVPPASLTFCTLTMPMKFF